MTVNFVGEFAEMSFPLKKKEEIIKLELFSSSEKKDLDPEATESCICGEHPVTGRGRQMFSWLTLWETRARAGRVSCDSGSRNKET